MRGKDLKQEAYSYIKGKIISGEFPAGQDIIEDELQKQIGVSRTPIREALMRLQHESLVEIYARKGIFVAPITVQMINNVYQIREIVEPSIILLTGKTLDRARIAGLEARCENFPAETDKNGLNNYFISLDSELHAYFIGECKNDLLVKIMNNILDHDQRIRIQAYKINGRYTISNREHMNFLRALLDGDISGAAELMREHIVKSRDVALNLSNLVR
jgi:DNA-binding GntR family transcriptional regulator